MKRRRLHILSFYNWNFSSSAPAFHQMYTTLNSPTEPSHTGDLPFINSKFLIAKAGPYKDWYPASSDKFAASWLSTTSHLNWEKTRYHSYADNTTKQAVTASDLATQQTSIATRTDSLASIQHCQRNHVTRWINPLRFQPRIHNPSASLQYEPKTEE